MTMRSTTGAWLDSVLGTERTNTLRTAERSARQRLADTIRPTPPPSRRKRATKKAATAPRWQPSDPFVAHPTPPMGRHQLLDGLHGALHPRTYFEVGVADGASMALSRATSLGVDPAFHVEHEVRCDLQLVQATSDDFFAREDAFAHLGGLPVDLAFIDGMHLSEFALRDVANTERHLGPASVVLLDDMLPRNGLEAARERKTLAWAGDVYKVADILMRERPDLTVVPVNTAPTGTVMIVGFGAPCSSMDEIVASAQDVCTAPDPQTVPEEFLTRSTAVDPRRLLALDIWPELVRRRDAGETAFDDLWDAIRTLPTG